MRPDSARRILGLDELLRRYGRPRETNVVFTNGVFDLLHRGHVSCLAAARALGDVLVVGVNSDASAARLKGEGRPYVRAADRAYLVASLRCVDAVTIFEEDTPAELIARLLPDVLVKGGDYSADEIVGADEVRVAGGEVRIVPLEKGHSTSALVAKIRRRTP